MRTIEDQNRHSDGTYSSRELQSGDSIYVNCRATDILTFFFPQCSNSQTIFPCLYQVKDFDTLISISEDFWDGKDYSRCIELVNKGLPISSPNVRLTLNMWLVIPKLPFSMTSLLECP